MLYRRTIVFGLFGLLVGGMMGSEGFAQKKGLPGEINTPPARGERYQDRLKVGDFAPDFTLPDPSGKSQWTLSNYRGKKPVVLIFGSYT